MKKIFYAVIFIIPCNIQAMHEELKGSSSSSYVPFSNECHFPIATPNSPAPKTPPPSPCTPPNSPYTSYCPSTTPPASDTLHMADYNFVELTAANVSMATDLELNQTSNRKYADHRDTLQKFKDQAQQLINNLPKDDIEAYLSGNKALRKLQSLHVIAIKKIDPLAHIEFSTEKSIYTRKIHHLCSKAIATAQKKQHIRHMNIR